MSRQTVLSSLVTLWLAVPALAMFLAATPARAQIGSGDYMFLMGSGFLCDSGDSSACPAVVKSEQGDSYEFSGAGTLSARGKSVTATGTFAHKSPSGMVLDTGVWTASELVSFDSYGIAPSALMRGGRTFGPSPVGPGRLRMLSGSMPAGGLAVFRIRLLPMWGVSRTATLQINCALGKVPDERQTEGIRLAFEGGGVAFDEEVSGRTLFVLTRQRASPAAKAPAPKGESNPPLTNVQR